MTNYSDNEYMCRCDVFKASGKWYDTIALNMAGLYNAPVLRDAIRKALHGHPMYVGSDPDTYFVVLEPHHVHSHPVMIRRGRLSKAL